MMNSNIQPICSAVMVIHELCSDSLILTQRSDQLRHHPGEVCFPGGVQEEQDSDLYATAARELYEELGISADRLEVIKELKTERTLLGAIIHPWLANIQSVEPYRLNQAEVTRLISIPMQLVRDPQHYKIITITRFGKQYQTCEFNYPQAYVWGATARIMQQLIRQ